MRRSSRSSLPRRASAVARMPLNTPRAVCADGSPPRLVLVTWVVCRATQSMSALEVPLSTAVM